MENSNFITKKQSQRYCISHPILPTKPKPQKKTWISFSKPGKEVTKIKEEAILKQICYSEKTTSGPFKCGLYFYHFLFRLSKKTPLALQIPETLIFGYGFDTPTLLYTDSLGYIRYKTKLNTLQVETVQKIFEYHRNFSKRSFPIPLGVIKSLNSQYNRVLMKSSEFSNEVRNGFKSDVAIQRFVLPKGNKACKLRVVWDENNETKYYSITNKTRFDGKEIKKKFFFPYETNVSNETEVKNTHIFDQVHEKLRIKPINLNRTESEILSLGHRYLHDKNLVGRLIELGTDELQSDLVHLDFQDSDSLPLLPQKTITMHKTKRTELEKYLKESLSLSFTNNTSLEHLYKKLYGQDNLTCPENTNKEEQPTNSNITNKLRSMFCIDSNNPKKTLAFEIKTHLSLHSVDNLIQSLRKAINSRILAKDHLHLSHLVCDFTEDSNQVFYLMKFEYYATKSSPLRIEKSLSIEEAFICPGKYCSKQETLLENPDENTQEKHYPPNKFKIFKNTLMENEETDIQKIIKPILHQTVEVCKNCFYVYLKKEREKLKISDKNTKKQEVTIGKERFTRPIGSFKRLSIERKAKKKGSIKSLSKTDFFKDNKRIIFDQCRYNEF